MTLYRYRIEPRSAFATPMRSDTLYGHLLWAAAELHGAGKVEELLTAFRSPEPPFRLSSAFPQGFLPMPVLPPLPRDEVAGGDRAAKVQALSQWKRFRRLAWLPLELWCRLRHHLSLRRLWEAFRQEPEQFEVPESFTWHQPHVALDRRTGSVRDEGGLSTPPCSSPHAGTSTWKATTPSCSRNCWTTSPPWVSEPTAPWGGGTSPGNATRISTPARYKETGSIF